MATLRRRGWGRGVFSGMHSTSGSFSSKISSSFSFYLDTFIDRGPHTRAFPGSDIKKRKKNNSALGNSTSSLLRWIKRRYRHFIRCSFSESSKKMRIRHQILTETEILPSSFWTLWSMSAPRAAIAFLFPAVPSFSALDRGARTVNRPLIEILTAMTP